MCPSLEEALKLLHEKPDIETCWIIGGSSVYKKCMELPNCHRIYLTQIEQEFECDSFFPPIDNDTFSEISKDEMDVTTELQKEGDITYCYKIFQKRF